MTSATVVPKTVSVPPLLSVLALATPPAATSSVVPTSIVAPPWDGGHASWSARSRNV